MRTRKANNSSSDDRDGDAVGETFALGSVPTLLAGTLASCQEIEDWMRLQIDNKDHRSYRCSLSNVTWVFWDFDLCDNHNSAMKVGRMCLEVLRVLF